MLFKDRFEAGCVLAQRLLNYADRADALVLGLARGGVPVAFEVAQALHAPLDVFIVRKLGVPGQEELAMGAIAPGDVTVINWSIMDQLDIAPRALQAVIARESQELTRRELVYRGQRPPLDASGRTVILIDDGLATGSTMRAAIAGVRKQGADHVVVAVPVGASQTCDEMSSAVDELICAATPTPFYGVGRWYRNFSQTTDEEVRQLLEQAHSRDRPGTC
jgi:putative phosphoribosyl transferase